DNIDDDIEDEEDDLLADDNTKKTTRKKIAPKPKAREEMNKKEMIIKAGSGRANRIRD
ncbi:unnamed protein product, partial [Amoebophrya sp. A120]